MATCQQILVDALQDIGALGLNESEAHGEDMAKALRLFNRRGSNWNTRKGFSKFERMQTFPVTVSKDHYTIGGPGRDPDGFLNPALDPDFIVASGGAPLTIDHANWVQGTGPNRLSWNIEIIEVQEYSEAFMPGFVGVWPYAIYYQTTFPASTIWPWPVPSDTIDALQLFWWDQFVPVATADISLELFWPEGYELAFALTLAEDLCLPFGKEAPASLTRAAAQARADATSPNRRPPRLDTTGDVAPNCTGWSGSY